MKIVYFGDRVISKGEWGRIGEVFLFFCGFVIENFDNIEDIKNVFCRDILGCIDCKYIVELLLWKWFGC